METPLDERRPGRRSSPMCSSVNIAITCLASPVRHLRTRGRSDRPLGYGGLGRPYGGAAGSPLPTAWRVMCEPARPFHADDTPGSHAPSRAWPDEDRPIMVGGARRAALRIDGAFGGSLSLLAGPQSEHADALLEGCRSHLHADVRARS